MMPIHWCVLPPSEATLWTLFACGYDDAERRLRNFKQSETLRDLAHAPLPAGAQRPVAPGGMGRFAIYYVIIKGWLNLLLMTAFVPLVPFYFAYRELSRLQEPRHHVPAWSVVKVVLRHSLIVALLILTWPLVQVYVGLRWCALKFLDVDEDTPGFF